MAESSSVFDYEPAHDADAPPAFSDVVHDLDERRPDGNSSARVTGTYLYCTSSDYDVPLFQGTIFQYQVFSFQVLIISMSSSLQVF